MTYVPGMSMLAWRLSKGSANGQGQIAGPKRKTGLDIFGDGPYPHSLDHFVGQLTARVQIVAAMTAAVKQQQPMDHLLLASGTPGIGKTTLAKLVAFHLDVGIVELGGLVGDREVKMALHQMRRGDVLFLDEVHRLVNRGKARAEWLLQLLQDGELVTPQGVVPSPGITVIAATTDAQKLPQTILDRFLIQPVLEPYTDQEAAQIAAEQAKRVFGDFVPMPEQTDWLVDVARACGNNPRRMTMLLTNVRNTCLSGEPPVSERGYDISQARDWSGLTEDGLDALEQGYLTGLYSYGGHAGISTLRALLNEEQLGQTEKRLIQRGYITIGTKGRELTGLGVERAQALVQSLMP